MPPHRRHCLRSVTLALLFAAAPSAQGATLPFEATLSIVFQSLSLELPAGSGVALVNGSGGGTAVDSITLPHAIVSTHLVVPVTDPAAHPIRGVVVDVANDPGLFERTSGGGLNGIMALPGLLKICLFDPCAIAPANISVPLSVIGAGGTSFASSFVDVTVEGAPWTTGITSTAFGSVLASGFAHGPLSATGSTASPGGALRLVSPLFLMTNIPAQVPIQSYVMLDIRFVPEPQGLLVLGGAIALALLGAHRHAAN